MSLFNFRSSPQSSVPTPEVTKDLFLEEMSAVLKMSDVALEVRGKELMDHISGNLKMMQGTIQGTRGDIYTRKDLAYATLDFLDGKEVMISSTNFNLRESVRLLAAVKKAYYIRNKGAAWDALSSSFRIAMIHIHK